MRGVATNRHLTDAAPNASKVPIEVTASLLKPQVVALKRRLWPQKNGNSAGMLLDGIANFQPGSCTLELRYCRQPRLEEMMQCNRNKWIGAFIPNQACTAQMCYNRIEREREWERDDCDHVPLIWKHSLERTCTNNLSYRAKKPRNLLVQATEHNRTKAGDS